MKRIQWLICWFLLLCLFSVNAAFAEGDQAAAPVTSAKTASAEGEQATATVVIVQTTPVPARTAESIPQTEAIAPPPTDGTAALAGETSRVKVITLGLYQTVVELGNERRIVPTADLTFSDSVPAERKLAVIYTPRTGKATMRAEASKRSAIVKTSRAGSVVSVLEIGAQFSLVSDGGDVGYVLNHCLQFHAPLAKVEGKATLTCKGKADGATTVNLRTRPLKNSAKVATWKTGTRVTVIAHEGGWYEVEAEGKRGFVMAEFLTMAE